MPILTCHPACLEPLERRALLSGVTLITHGFGGSAEGWVTAMGDLVARQSGTLANQPRYRMTVTDPGHDGGALAVSSARVGPTPAQWVSREIVVLLDWSDVAGSLPFGGYHRTTGAVGAAVAEKLLSPFSIPDLAAPLAELPIHLLGHSRGASLVSEIARGLGQRGAWVDQLSYFDPHPVDGVREPFGFDFGDAPMRVYDNVLFADNYWRSDGSSSFDFTGEAVTGAHNLQLSESVLSGAGYSNEHSDTHLFYHGTIGPVGGPFENSDGGASVGANWYASPHPSRDSTGWRYSRIAASGTRPAGGSKFSGASRDSLTLTAADANVWDNIQISGLLSDFTFVQGQSITVPVQWADVNDDAVVTVGLDRDDDPYNGVFSDGGAGAGGSGAAFATATVDGSASFVQLDTADIAGRFRVYAQIGNGTNTRYYYAPGRATITAAGFDTTWVGPPIGNWSVPAHWSTSAAPSAAQSAAIYHSAVTLGSTVRVAGLHLNDDARLDVGANMLVIDYGAGEISPLASLAANLAAGRGLNGDWSGASGIVSSVAATGAGLTTLGIGEAADLYGLTPSGTADVAGQTVDATTIVIKYTYDGDANLDGRIDAGDYGIIDNFVQIANASGYFNGDFNYDGFIDAGDYGIIDNNVQAQGVPL